MTEDLSKEIAERLEKLKDLEVLSNDHSNVISGLISLEYIMKAFISDFESDISVSQFVYGMDNTRNGFYFHYLVLERMVAENFPMYLVRFRRVAIIADEGFEKIYQKYYQQNKDGRDIDPMPSLKLAHNTLITLIQEMYDQFPGLGYLYPNPFRGNEY
jgi:hypothetical protein